MSFERVAKDNIKSLYPEAYAEGSFAKRVMGSYTMNFDEPGMIIRDSWSLGVVPDCYFHFWFPNNDHDGGVDYFIVCEVEDTNPLTKNKLSIYGQLWDHMHCNLSVWSFNRYGHFATAHRLDYWYYHDLQELKRERGLELNSMPPSIHTNMREPLFPDNEKFFEGYHPPCDHWKKYKPWSEERRLRVFKNTKNLKQRHHDFEEAYKYYEKYGVAPLTFANKYPDEVFTNDDGSIHLY